MKLDLFIPSHKSDLWNKLYHELKMPPWYASKFFMPRKLLTSRSRSVAAAWWSRTGGWTKLTLAATLIQSTGQWK